MKGKNNCKRLIISVLITSLAIAPVTTCVWVNAQTNIATVSADEELTPYYSSWNEAYEALKSYCGIADASHYNEAQGDLINAFLDKWPDILYGATEEDEANYLLKKAKEEFDALPLDDEEAMKEHAKFMAEREKVFNEKMAVMESYIANIDYTGDSRFDYETAAREALGTILNASDYEVLNAGVEAFENCVSLLVEVSPALKAAQNSAKEELAEILANEYENITTIDDYYSRIDNCNSEDEIASVVEDCKEYMLACVNVDITTYRKAKREKIYDYTDSYKECLGDKFNELDSYMISNLSVLNNATTKAEVDSAYSELIEMIDAKVADLTGADTPAPTEGLLYELIDKRDKDNNFVYDAEGNKVQVVQITGISHAVSQLVIPSEIDGYPVTVIGLEAFKEQAISEVIFPDTITEIKTEAFKGCNLLTSVTLPKSLEKLGHDAFGSCVRLEEVWIPKSLEKCGYAYSGDHILESTWGPFINCDNLKEAEFEEGTTIIANELFANCKGLEKIEIPDTVTEIKSTAFLNCVNLREIVFSKEDNLTRIYSSAFKGCAGLTSIVLPDSVKRIDTYAFSECSSLKDVKLSKLEELGGGAFYDCDSLESIVIPKTLLKVPTSVTIGATNAQFVFSECDRLKTITFEEGITEIADGLFYKCKVLESIELPNSITLIGANAFYQCSALNEVKLSKNLQKIESHAFGNCNALKSITIPVSVTNINKNVFEGIEDFTIYGYSGSYAEEYANACEINFVSLGTVGFGEEDVYRIAGKNRYKTSLAAAEVLKAQNNGEKFDAVILADGRNFPDALAGSYLAGKLNAPILMANEKPQYAEPLRAFINENLKTGGTIYILGGTGAVPDSVVQGLEEFEIKRLAGKNRYATNLLILEEAGVADEEILVCTGRGFADSLSASATGKPILLVGKSVTEEQQAFMSVHQGNLYYIVGGEGAVSKEIEAVVSNYGTVERIAGNSRYETSIAVAEAFFESPDTAVLASAKNFPDGLCGGPLAMSKNAPLILTATGKEASAAVYAKANGIHIGAVLGGAGLISDEATNSIFESTAVTEW